MYNSESSGKFLSLQYRKECTHKTYSMNMIFIKKNEEKIGSFRALLFAINENSSATNFPKNIGNIFKI